MGVQEKDNKAKHKWWFFLLVAVFVILIPLWVYLIINKSWFFAISNNPYEIGDALGGITNPIIGIGGIILTFLAFYMQYQANKQQREMFNQGIINERSRIDEIERKEKEKQQEIYKTNIQIFLSLLNTMKNNFKTTGNHIKEYIAQEKISTLANNNIVESISNEYNYYQKLDFVELYKSISFNLKDKHPNWEIEFMNVIGIIEFYNEAINEFYKEVRERNAKRARNLTEIGKTIEEEMPVHMRSKKFSYLIDAKKIQEIFVNQEKKLTGTENTSFIDFRDLVLNKTINALKQLATPEILEDRDFLEFSDFFSKLRKQINAVEFNHKHYILKYEQMYNTYFKNEKLFKSLEDFGNKLKT